MCFRAEESLKASNTQRLSPFRMSRRWRWIGRCGGKFKKYYFRKIHEIIRPIVRPLLIISLRNVGRVLEVEGLQVDVYSYIWAAEMWDPNQAEGRKPAVLNAEGISEIILEKGTFPGLGKGKAVAKDWLVSRQEKVNEGWEPPTALNPALPVCRGLMLRSRWYQRWSSRLLSP